MVGLDEFFGHGGARLGYFTPRAGRQHLQFSGLELLDNAGVFLLKEPAAHQGLDPGQQDGQVTGLGEEVIGAGFEGAMHIPLGLAVG